MPQQLIVETHRNPAHRRSEQGIPAFAPPSGGERRRLVVVADDLGRSREVNRAVALAHDQGILGSASVMAGGEAFEDAVETALARPALSIGLHVTLCDGRSVLPPSRIPDLVRSDGRFRDSPLLAGVHYFLARKRLQAQMEAEVEAQFDRAERAGLRLHHLDGHHHLHMHPLIFDAVCRRASGRGVSWIRLTGEDLGEWIDLRSPLSLPPRAIIRGAFGLLQIRGRRRAAAAGLRSADRIYGLSRTGAIDERYLASLFPRMRGSINELFTHPDQGTTAGRTELAALLSKPVSESAKAAGLSLSSYQELTERRAALAPESGST